MDVLGVGEGWFATDQALEARNNLATVVQSGVGKSGSVDSKECAVDKGAGGRQTGRRKSNEAQSRMEGDILGWGIGLVSDLIE